MKLSVLPTHNSSSARIKAEEAVCLLMSQTTATYMGEVMDKKE